METTNYGSGIEKTWSQNNINFGGKSITAADPNTSNNNTIQTQASNGILYNISEIPGKIKKIKITQKTAVQTTLYVGNTSRIVNSVSANTTINNGTSKGALSLISSEWDLSSDTNQYTYFALKRGSSASYWSSIEITYEAVSSEAPILTNPQIVTGIYGEPLNYIVENTGGNPSSWSIANDNLPEELTFSNGVFSGTPFFRHPFTTEVTATNSLGFSTATINFNIAKANQIVTRSDNITKTFGDPTFSIGAISQLPLNFEIVSGQPTDVISLSGNQVTLLNAGNTKIRAYNEGDDFYEPVEKIIDVTISKANQSIAFDISDVIGYLGEEINRNMNVSNQNLPLTIVSANEEIAFYNEGKIYLVGIGNTIFTISQPGNRNYNALTQQTFNVKVKDPNASYCFEEDFNEINTGNSISTGGSSTRWYGNDNFTTNNYVYQAGKAIKLSNGSNAGRIESKALNGISGSVLVEINVKGWTSIPGQITITLGGITKALPVVALMSDDYQLIRVPFYNVPEDSKLIIQTGTKSVFIDAVRISCNSYEPLIKVASKVTDDSFQANWKEIPESEYLLDVYSKNKIINYAPDLYISEYVEGSGNNRALEFYNGTGEALNLNLYSLKKQANGSGDFKDTYQLPDFNLQHGESYVIVYDQADKVELRSMANRFIDSNIMAFNGNDAIRLYKDDIVIDQVGIHNSSSNWGADVTLRRKPEFVGTINYNADQWENFSNDTFDGLGSHDQNLIEEVKTYLFRNRLTTASQNFHVVTGIEKFEDYYYVVRSKLNNKVSVYSDEMDVKRTYYENGSWSTGRQPDDEFHSVVLHGVYNDLLIGKSITINNGNSNTITEGNTYFPKHSFDVLSGSITFEENAYLLQVDDESLNFGNATFKRNATFFGYDSKFWSSPVAGQKIKKSDANDDTGFFYNPSAVYNYNEARRNWIRAEESNFLPPKGYIIQVGTNIPFNQNGNRETFFQLSFTGVPNNGEYTIPSTKLSWGDNGVGNPYGSPISMERFMEVNDNVAALYFWNEDIHYNPASNPASYDDLGQRWFSFNGVGSNSNNKTHIGTGVGFIARVYEPGELIFNNSMRDDVANDLVENRNQNQKDRFWLSLNSDNNKENQILIGYVEGATNGIDEKYDAKNISNNNSFILSNSNNNAMIIEGRQYPLDTADIIPLYFRASKAKEYTIKLENKEGIFNSQPIYLIDNELDKSINLNEVIEYTFDSDLGNFTERFEIRYQPKETLATLELDNTLDLIVYKDNKVNEVTSKENVKAYSVYDFSGKLITKEKVNHLKSFVLPILDKGIYVIKFTLENGKIITKKVIF